MARKKSQAFPTVILLLALAASVALLGYLLLSPVGPDTAGGLSENGGEESHPIDYEFFTTLTGNEVQVNSPNSEPPAPEPGPNEVENMVDQLTADPSPPLNLATEALEQIAESIVAGLDTPVPDPVAAPEPTPPVPVAPPARNETVLAAPTQATQPVVRGRTGTLLQSGAFRQQDLALSELQRQRSLGLEVEMRQRPGQNGPLFLLQSGPYDSRDRLEEAELVFRLNNIDTARLSSP